MTRQVLSENIPTIRDEIRNVKSYFQKFGTLRQNIVKIPK
jgi:hypothetical protein